MGFVFLLFAAGRDNYSCNNCLFYVIITLLLIVPAGAIA